MYINELVSIDVNKLHLEKVNTEEFEKYFKTQENADLKTTSEIKVGISKDSNMALFIVKVQILDEDSHNFLELNVDFFFSITNNNKDKPSIFDELLIESNPFISLEIVNLVKNLTYHGTNSNTIILPYDFLKNIKE